MTSNKSSISRLMCTGALAALVGGMLFFAHPSPAKADGFAISVGDVHIGYWNHGHRYYRRWHRDWYPGPVYYHRVYYRRVYYRRVYVRPVYYHRIYFHRVYYHPAYYRVVYRERDWRHRWGDRGWHRGSGDWR